MTDPRHPAKWEHEFDWGAAPDYPTDRRIPPLDPDKYLRLRTGGKMGLEEFRVWSKMGTSEARRWVLSLSARARMRYRIANGSSR